METLNTLPETTTDITVEERPTSSLLDLSPLERLQKTTFSYSKLRTLTKEGAATYYRKYIVGEDRPMSASAAIGIAVHSLLLEPNEFEQQFLVIEKLDKRLKGNKERYLEYVQQAEAENKILLNTEEFNNAGNIASALAGDERVQELLVDAEKEVELRWTEQLDDNAQEVNYVAFLDILNRRQKTIADLKIINGSQFNPSKFASKAKAERYHIQTGLYLKGSRKNQIDVNAFKWILVKDEPPYDIAIARADAEFIERGIAAAENASAELYERILTDYWVSYPDEIVVGYVPW